jgi:hypothetical protein
MPNNGIKILQLMNATPVEVEQIRLALIDIRRSKGVTMTGVDNWRLYYPAAQQSINVVPIPIQPKLDRTPSAASSNTSLDNLIAVADEHLGIE